MSKIELKKISKEFKKNGVVTLRNIISKKKINECLKSLKEYKNHLPALRDDNLVYDVIKKNKKNIKYLQHIQNYIPNFFYLFNSKLLKISEALLGQDVYFECMGLHDKAPGFGTQSPYHQDNFYFCLKPSHALTAYIPLEKQDKRNGELKYIPRTHNKGVLKHIPGNTKAFSSGLVKQNYKSSEIFYPNIKAGDVVFHHCNIIHGADGNLSSRHRRAIAIKIVGIKAKLDKKQLQIYKQFRKKNRSLN